LAWIDDKRDDAAATATGARQNVLGEHPAQQISPRQPASTRRDGVERRPMNEVFPFDQAAKPYERMMSGGARFRCVLEMKR
jgi:hypothetical protein